MMIIFWTLLFFIGYCYLFYPFFIYLLACFNPRPVHKEPIEPTVSIVTALHNEEDVIASKIKNLLDLDYPTEKLEILFGSDASEDATHEIIGRFHDSRIKLFVNCQRQGKMATLNNLIKKAKNEIIVFTDARQLLAKDVIKQLVANFSDRHIGCVSGELIFYDRQGSIAQGINLYWNYEKFIRRQESKVHSLMGATGAIYAIRKRLFMEGPASIVLDDMYIPFKIVEQGYRAIFDEEAMAFDQAADNPREEYRRKTRTIYGNYQIFGIFKGLFNPIKSPIAWQLFSHKFLRAMIPFFLIVLFLMNYLLRHQSCFGTLWSLQIAFYATALIGQLTCDYKKGFLKGVSKLCYISYVFCLLNYSALVGFFRFVILPKQATWQKAREL